MQLLTGPLEGRRAPCNVIFACAETPFCWRTCCQEYSLYFGIARKGHSQSNPTNKVCVDTEFLLSDISGNKELTFYMSIALTTQRNLGVALKGELSFSENALTLL